jgi:hypothetical protein
MRPGSENLVRAPSLPDWRIAPGRPWALRDATPLAAGSTRLVYAHPAGPDLLIKVLRKATRIRHGSGSRLKQLRTDRPVKLFLREIREQLLLTANGESPLWFLQAICGFVETDLGVGLVVEALRGADGDLAPTLVDLIRRGGFDGEARADLARFVGALRESDVALCAVGPVNVVYAQDPALGRRFVLVDGFGERGFLPVKRISRILHRHTKERQLSWFTAEVERLLAGSAPDQRAA